MGEDDARTLNTHIAQRKCRIPHSPIHTGKKWPFALWTLATIVTLLVFVCYRNCIQ